MRSVPSPEHGTSQSTRSKRRCGLGPVAGSRGEAIRVGRCVPSWWVTMIAADWSRLV